MYSVMAKDHDLYSEKMISIPAPRFVIFYNGEKKRPEQEVLRLSDAYFIREEHPALELEALQELIAKKLEKGLSVQEIAEALEEEPDTIRNLITHKKEG